MRGIARSPASETPPAEAAFAGIFGLLLGIGLLKFGNPVILDHLVETPKTLDEWRVFAWPVRFAYLGLVIACVPGLLLIRRDWRLPPPRWPVIALILWFAWQLLAATRTIDSAATRAVIPHFIACLTCLLLGRMALARVSEIRVFWLCLIAGFIGVLAMACDQRFGSLAETRRMILYATRPETLPPEYLLRIQSNRVFGTLVYPNALAGAILLLLPVACVQAWNWGQRWGVNGARAFGGLMLVGGIAVLTWSGSKAGWLLAIACGLFLLFHSSLSRRTKLLLGAGFACAGLAAFAFLYAERLSQGATSVAARFDYWSAALKGASEKPFLGHGPGAFKKVYSRVKRPESEMAQLAHNDYLQQATDSGWPGFLAYAAAIVGSLAWLYRHRRRLSDPLPRAAALGVGAWFAQGMVEFGLYIPATSWCAFALLGWLLAQNAPDPVPRNDEKPAARKGARTTTGS